MLAAGSFVESGSGAEFGGDPVAEMNGFEHFGACAPGENPVDQIRRDAHAQGENGSAVGLRADFLTWVPFSFGGDSCGEGIEEEADGFHPARLKNGKTPGQKFLEVKILGSLETQPPGTRTPQARQGERAQFVPLGIAPHNIPLIRNAAEMIRMDPPLPGYPVAQSRILENQLSRFHNRLRHDAECPEFGAAQAGRFEGKGIRQMMECHPIAFVHAGCQLVEGTRQGFFKRGAAILLDGLLPHQNGDQFAAGNGEGWQVLDGTGIVKAVPDFIIGNGHLKLVAHEINIPLRGLGTDFQLPGQRAAVREALLAQKSVDFDHPNQRRA